MPDVSLAHAVTVREAAEMLGISRVRVLQLVKANKIRIVYEEPFPGRPRLWLNEADVQRRRKH